MVRPDLVISRRRNPVNVQMGPATGLIAGTWR
jgi:hypothetical protein